MQRANNNKNSIGRRFARCLAILGLLGLANLANAQVLEEVEVSNEGDRTTIDIRLLAQVNYQRFVVTPSGNVVQVYFTITAADEGARSVVEETRSVPVGDTLSAFSVRFISDRRTGIARHVDLEFREPVEVVRAGLAGDNRSLRIVLKTAPLEPVVAEALPAPRPLEPAPASAAPTPESEPATPAPSGASEPSTASAPPPGIEPPLEDPAAALLTARSELEAGHNDNAVALLNRILNLPPNAATQEAQELIGNAREALKEGSRARAEYELYLKLYPDGPGAERVKGRLANLKDSQPVGRDGKVREPQWIRWGSVSQSYYGGQSRIRNETTIITPATDSTVIDVQSLSNTDQSAIVSNFDANARYRSQDWDNRFVVRDVATYSFLSGTPSENRLSALYGDFRSERAQAGARIGRQSSTGNGVLGRYDGATLGWNFRPHWKAIALAGTPAEVGLGARKTFAGAAIEADGMAEGLSTSVFAITQRTESFDDRTAVGAEVRYFRPTLSVFSLFDYDTNFSTVNVGSVQGSWTPAGGATVNFLYDYRRSPTLQLSNALLGETVTTLRALRETLTLDEIERQALGLSPVSKVLLLGATYPLNTQWQFGLEGRVSSVGGTAATATLPATVGTGDVYTVTAQAIATGLFIPSSVLVLSTSRLTSRDFDAWLFAANSRVNVNERWSLEPSLRWYAQDNATGSTLRRLAPSLRSTYRLRDSISLEAEVTLESSKTKAALTSEKSNLVFYYIGYRIDL